MSSDLATLPTVAAIIAGVVALIALGVAFRMASRFGRLQSEFQKRLQQELELWRQREVSALRSQLEQLAGQKARVDLKQWKAEQEQTLRDDAIQRSQAVTQGKVFEQLTPYLPGFAYNPKDARFIGSPVDFIVFDGLSEDQCHRIVFVEVKTGASSLSSRERKVRDAIKAKRIEWQELRLDPGAQTHDRGPSRGQDARDRQRGAVRRPDSPTDAAAILKGVRGLVKALLSPAPRG